MVKALKEFYGDLFDWKIARHAPAGDYWYIENVEGGNPWRHYANDGRRCRQTTSQSTYKWMTYRHAWTKRRVLAVKQIVPPTAVPGGMGHIGVFVDPAGNNIGLHKF